jgi:hypothetical protein
LITSGDDACGGSLLEAVRAQRAKGVRTAVIVLSAAPAPLDDAALAGGVGAACPNRSDAECGPHNTCDPVARTCTHPTYLASNADELRLVLENLVPSQPAFGGPPVCDRVLETVPPSINRMRVFVDDVMTPPGTDTWALTGPEVRFQGALCDRLQASTVAQPMKIEIVVDDQP